jgi:hypothetical protein
MAFQFEVTEAPTRWRLASKPSHQKIVADPRVFRILGMPVPKVGESRDESAENDKQKNGESITDSSGVYECVKQRRRHAF